MKIMVACWLASVISMPVMAQVHANANTDFSKLATGSAQAVLACVVIGLSAAIIYLTKQLLRAKDDSLTVQKETSEKVLNAISENSTALEQNANAQKESRDAIYSLRNSVDGFAKAVETCKVKQ